MNIIKQSFGLAAILLLLSNFAIAADRPQTMDEMWKIIEAQQKQLDAMQKMLEESQAVPPSKAKEEGKAVPQRET